MCKEHDNGDGDDDGDDDSAVARVSMVVYAEF